MKGTEMLISGTINTGQSLAFVDYEIGASAVLATSKSGTLLLRRDQGEMAVFWDSLSRRL